MELGVIIAALRRFWLVIVLTTVAAAGITGAVTVTQPAEYTATAQGMVSISNPGERPPYALASGAQYILDRMTSYANIGVTTPVLDRVVEELGLDTTALALSSRISSHSVVGKAVMEVAVTDTDPRNAAAEADAVLAQMSRAVNDVERGNVQLVPIGAALPPTSPSNRKTVVNTAVAGAGGLVLGCFLALGLQLVAARGQRTRGRGRVRDAEALGARDG